MGWPRLLTGPYATRRHLPLARSRITRAYARRHADDRALLIADDSALLLAAAGPAKVVFMVSATAIVPVTTALLVDCLAFDHLAVSDSDERSGELASAAAQGRMRVAKVDDRVVGYSVLAPWFFGAPFLTLLYVDPTVRGRGIGSQLLEDFERTQGPHMFTSTNLTNAPMQRLLQSRQWTPCGMLTGLDEGDPEIFFVKTL